MPIYEYHCQACHHDFEKLQKISDEPLVDCPDCAKPTLTKMMSASAFRLKGSGWYETDFKTGAKKNLNTGSDNSAKPETSAEKSTAGNADSGSEQVKTKAENKTESKSDNKTGNKTGNKINASAT